jgi:hypothetical protein
LTFSRQRFTLKEISNMTTPDNQNLLPLDELNIVPDWLKAAPKSYEHHSGEDAGPRRGRGDRPDRDRRPPRPRPEGTGARPPRPQGDRPPRREGGPMRREGGAPRRDGPPFRREDAPQQRRDDRRPQAEHRPPTLAPVDINFIPEEQGLTAMIETMKHSTRTYALFDVAKLILNKPERHLVKLARKPAADGTRAPLHIVLADETVFPTQSDALHHVFRKHADKICRTEKKPCDPPKGNYTSVNRCGITGEIFGPSNHHDYQSAIVRFHQRRLRHMPFEDFKSRITTVKDEAAIKQWIESRSFITEHHCVLCTEPKPLATREALEKHVIETHLAALLNAAPELQINGVASRQQPWAALAEAIRIAYVSEYRFPLRSAQLLSDKLRPHGFHFFKHRKGITYVSHIKPKRIETLDGLSDQIQKTITFLRAHPDSVRKQIADNLQITDQERFLADVHWLITEGYVVEFSDGRLWALENKIPEPERKPEPGKDENRPLAGQPNVAATPEPAPVACSVNVPSENSAAPAPENPPTPCSVNVPATSEPSSDTPNIPAT